MAHFAELDQNNVVTRVIVVNDNCLKDENGIENEELGSANLESIYGGKWIQTSYNNNIRVHYAAIGFSYNQELDAFIPPKPHPSWVLNETTVTWEAPVPEPTDAPEGSYYKWNEENQSWELITPPTE